MTVTHLPGTSCAEKASPVQAGARGSTMGANWEGRCSIPCGPKLAFQFLSHSRARRWQHCRAPSSSMRRMGVPGSAVGSASVFSPCRGVTGGSRQSVGPHKTWMQRITCAACAHLAASEMVLWDDISDGFAASWPLRFSQALLVSAVLPPPSPASTLPLPS